MFQLTLISDVFPLPPPAFNKDHHEQLRLLIHDRYTDRVIPNVGLGLALHSLLEIENARILPNDGRAHFKVIFRLLVFAPHKGEILEGKVKDADASGLIVSMTFFKDIQIPLVWMREPRHFDEKENCWYWDFEDHALPYRIGAPIRIRVKEIEFADFARQHPLETSDRPPMVIIGSVAEDGLGLRAWWT